MSAMLTVQGLKARYGAAQILDGVSFAVRKSAVTALLGRNGAFKDLEARPDVRDAYLAV
jgi:ABC-type branched-subunit amino acid transport system ATPase component